MRKQPGSYLKRVALLPHRKLNSEASILIYSGTLVGFPVRTLSRRCSSAGMPVRTLSRHTFTSSACGVCGSGSIERLAVRARPAVWTRPPLTPELVCDLPARLRAGQPLFDNFGWSLI